MQEPLARIIGATRRRINQAVGRRLRAHGLSPQRFWMLINLREAPGLSLGALAVRLHMGEPTASRIVTGLLRRRLVHAPPHSGDQRRRIIALTREGAALAEKLLPVATEVRQAVEAGFAPAEKEVLRRLLGRIIANMDRLEDECSGAAKQGRMGRPRDRDLVAEGE
jgi:DNA-binding MarR family transcriptional regulator